MTGLDVLRAQGFAPLQGKRVGLITNHTGRARDGAAAIDLLHDAKNVKLVALFGPEHGIRGVLDANVPAETDAKTGLPIHSLYGDTRRPTAAMLEGIDTLVIDLQDVGARFYTYMTTMAYVMEEAAKRKLPVVVLDRPNPVNGFQVEGPLLDKGELSFIGYFPMPIRHGMTHRRAGAPVQWREQDRRRPDRRPAQELEARRLVRRHRAAVDQPVAEHAQSDTRRRSIRASAPSSTRTSRSAAAPTRRSSRSGAPWIDGVKLAELLNGATPPGIRFYPVRFTPTASKILGRGMPGRVHGRHGSASPCVRCGWGSRSPAALQKLYGAPVRPRGERPAPGIEGEHRADQGRRGSGRSRGLVGGGREPLAAAAEPVPAVSLMRGIR